MHIVDDVELTSRAESLRGVMSPSPWRDADRRVIEESAARRRTRRVEVAVALDVGDRGDGDDVAPAAAKRQARVPSGPVAPPAAHGCGTSVPPARAAGYPGASGPTARVAGHAPGPHGRSSAPRAVSASTTSSRGCSTSASSSSASRSTTRSPTSIVAQLLHLESADPDKDISIYINSPGGSIYAGLAIYDTMQFIKPDVQTICCGIAMSMGSLLLTGGRAGQALLAAQQPDPDPPAVGRLRGPVDGHRDPRPRDPQDARADRRDLRPPHGPADRAGPHGHGARPLLQRRAGRRVRPDRPRDRVHTERARSYSAPYFSRR